MLPVVLTTLALSFLIHMGLGMYVRLMGLGMHVHLIDCECIAQGMHTAVYLNRICVHVVDHRF